jgi:hypothetical protein
MCSTGLLPFTSLGVLERLVLPLHCMGLRRVAEDVACVFLRGCAPLGYCRSRDPLLPLREWSLVVGTLGRLCD